MKELSNEAREAWRIFMPTLFVCMEIVAAIIFFILLPVGFIVGAVWKGLLVGFITGRDI